MKAIAIVLFVMAGCVDPTPYARPLWGDPCVADKGPDTVSGCTHPEDGTGDQGWGSPLKPGICAPSKDPEMQATNTGYCRPFCDTVENGLDTGDGRSETYYECPAGAVARFEIHGLAAGWGFCYCDDPDQGAYPNSSN